ncbi:hypothetical protein L1049_022561 [Liquidambar formosana]|uniref:Uncharacterized protein n=1 Tax=Liquidambar formosana TaxID=63359 RepID=A0AAP0RCL8_LIQFO
MRTGGTFNVTSTASPVQQHSPWHSPVPYLFGGLAAMLGLIAFALLILACSYWKLSGYLDGGDGGADGDGRDVESGKEDSLKAPTEYEEKILVIMAGQVKPTFLATPMSSRASSFGDTNKSGKTKNSEEVNETPKQGDGDQVQNGTMETHEAADQVH